MSKYGVIVSVLCLLSFSAVAVRAQEGILIPTAASMDFYGYIDGAGAGDVLTVYDGQGVLCGQFTIATAGRYGFVHVYGDDKATAVDEGAELNDPLTFSLNGGLLTPLANQEVLWLGDGQKQRVDFARR